eukprot:m.1590416 g.1590416  ORF g.1590416 m.1590416 type:complete len:2646 (+) comp25336_c0_seq1:57-7994(+)
MGVSREAKDVLNTLRADRNSSKANVRAAAFTATANFVTLHTKEPVAVYRMILQLLAPTVHNTYDTASRKGALAVISSVLAVDTAALLPTFITILSVSARPYTALREYQASGLGVAGTLLDWTCEALVFACTGLADDCREEWTALVRILGVLTTAVAAGRQRLSARCSRACNAAFQRAPAAIGKITAVFQRGPRNILDAGIGAKMMSFLCADADNTTLNIAPEVTTSAREAILDLFCKTVPPSTKVPTHATVLRASTAILSSCTHDEFKTKVLPSILTSIRRNLASGLPVLVWAVEIMKLDLSAYAEEIGGVLIDHLKHKDENIRGLANAGVFALTRRCTDTAAAEALFARFDSVLTGKGGGTKVTQSDLRGHLFDAMGALSLFVLGSKAKGVYACKVVDWLLAIHSKESDPNAVRAVEVAATLAASCKTLPATIAKVAGEILKTSKKGELKCAMLKCVLGSYTGAHVSDGAVLVPVVHKMFLEAKAADTETRYLAAAFLTRVAVVDADVTNNVILDGKTSKALLDEQHLTEKFLTSGLDCLKPHLEFAELSLQNPKLVGTDGEKGTVMYTSIVRMLTHPNHEVRRYTTTRMGVFLSNLASLAVHIKLIDAFATHLTALVAAHETDTPSSKKRKVLAHVLQQVCCALGVMGNATHASTVAVRLLLPAHHPLLLANPTRDNVWIKLLRKWNVALKDLCASEQSPMLDLLREAMAGSKTQCASAAAVGSMLATQQGNSDVVVDGLVNHVLSVLNTAEMTKITSTDMQVWETPAGTLLSERLNDEDDELEKLDPNRTKNYEEKVWEIKLKRELAKKKGLSTTSTKKLSKTEEQKRKAKLAEEGDTRALVSDLKHQGIAAITIALSLVRQRTAYAASRMACVVPVLLRHASHPLLGREACDALIVFGGTLDARLAPIAAPIGYAILRSADAADNIPKEWRESKLNDQIARVMRQLWAVTHDAEPLDIPSFGYCWPLLQHILMRSSLPGAVMEDALVFLTSHTHLGRSHLAPRKGILNLLSHVASNHERMAHQATMFMTAFVAEMVSAMRAQEVPPLDERDIGILLKTMQAGSVLLRRTALGSLVAVAQAQGEMHEGEVDDDVLSALWLANHDADGTIAADAGNAWRDGGYCLPASTSAFLLSPLSAVDETVRQNAAKALAGALVVREDTIDDTCAMLRDEFQQALIVPEPVRDHLGNIISPPHIDPWFFRSGIAQAWTTIAPLWPAGTATTLFRFIIDVGVRDPDSRTQEAVMAAGMALIDEAAVKGNTAELLQMLEGGLSATLSGGSGDGVRQSLIVLLGSMAKHMDKADPKIPDIVKQLIDALSTPSQAVQEAVATCIAPLMSAVKPQAPALLEKLLTQLLEHDNYGMRRGAAYGVSGLVKGLGVVVLKQQAVSELLQKAVQNKKNPRHREGALMAYELLCLRLGRLFEPYIMNLLPDLLVCYGDGNKDVRTAAEEAARAIMRTISSHGVKMLLPSLLNALEDNSWRTKLGSVELLGAMAFLAPKQLSASLPKIVPPLRNVLSDSHNKVQQAGRDALQKIGSVIKNPEIQAIAGVILAAIDDPSKHTKKCLRVLLETAFIHVIDAASLALIMPILERALNDRSTETKKAAAQIIGNMYSLTDAKDLEPYLPSLLPGVQEALLDPEPSVRGIAAKALGSTMRGIGEKGAPELLPWLRETMVSEKNTVDRSGAAQGLSEVLLALGNERMHEMLHEFIAAVSDTNSFVREGNMMMLVYLPAAFKEDFKDSIGLIIPTLLRGLSDVEEGVRHTTMRAAVGIINNFADTSVELLLPELEQGLFDDVWRIREASVKLLGELLYLLSGVTGKQTTAADNDDESFGTEESDQSIIDALGQETRDRVLAGIFMCRQDVAIMVRQAAAHVWKVVVPHTVRTLREVLPSVITLLLSGLGNEDPDRQSTAARTLSEVLRKLGERILPSVFPILDKKATSASVAERQGVCVALCEIIRNCTIEQLEPYRDMLHRTVRDAVVDEALIVRQAASDTFAALHTCIGPAVIEEVVTPILSEMHASMQRGDSTEFILDGMRQMIASKGSIILPLVVPKLLAPPLTVDNVSALSSLAAVAGDSINRHLSTILGSFMLSMASVEDAELMASLKQGLITMILSLDDEGIDTAIPELTTAMQQGDSVELRRAAAGILAEFCREAEVDYEEHYEDILEGALLSFWDEDGTVVFEAWGVLTALIPKFADAIPKYLRHTVEVLQTMADDGREVTGFAMTNGLVPLLDLIVKNGLQSEKKLDEHTTQAALEGLGYVIQVSPVKALNVKVALKITGAIISSASKSTGPQKEACLNLICLLLDKIPLVVKTMLPQLQGTCLKALREPHVRVRRVALQAVGMIAPRQRNLKPIFTDLFKGLAAAEGGEKEVFLQALAVVCARGGANAPADKLLEVIDQAGPLLDSEDDDVRERAAFAVGAVCRHLDAAAAGDVIKTWVVAASGGGGDADEWYGVHGRACALREVVCFVDDATLFGGSGLVAKTTKALWKSDNSMLTAAAAGLTTAWMAHPENTSGEPASSVGADKLLGLLSNKDTSKDTVGLVAAAIGAVARHRKDVSDAFLSLVGRTLYDTAQVCVRVAELDVAVAYLLRLGDREDKGATKDKYMTSILPANERDKVSSYLDGKVTRYIESLDYEA